MRGWYGVYKQIQKKKTDMMLFCEYLFFRLLSQLSCFCWNAKFHFFFNLVYYFCRESIEEVFCMYVWSDQHWPRAVSSASQDLLWCQLCPKLCPMVRIALTTVMMANQPIHLGFRHSLPFSPEIISADSELTVWNVYKCPLSWWFPNEHKHI